MPISVTDPISSAIRRAKLITFQPFDIRKWFVLGFSAFLASLGEGQGFNYSGGNSGGGPATPRRPAPPGTPAENPFAIVTEWISAHRVEAVVIAAAALLAGFAVYALLLWLSSRGKFMFMDGIARNVAEVAGPWKRFRGLANSLFRFRLCLMAISLVTACVIAGIALLIAWQDIQNRTFGSGAVAALIIGILLLLPTFILLGLIEWCTDTFVTTIMYARGSTVMVAWREFRTNILAGRVGTLFLFLLMSIVLAVAVGIGQMLLGCLTLCIGFLPYLSNVVTLPLEVFMRSYSIYFLQQFGPEYAVMMEPIPVYGFPVILPPPPLGPIA